MIYYMSAKCMSLRNKRMVKLFHPLHSYFLHNPL